MTWRRLLFWAHLAIGISIALFVAMLSATGALLAFQSEIIDWAERGDRIAQPQTSGCVAPSALLTAGEAATGRPATLIALSADPHRPAAVTLGDDTVLLMDPCRATVIDRNAGRLRGFFAGVLDLHRSITFQNTRHETLRSLKNAANLGFVLLIASGLVLWVPRKMRWTHVRASLLPRVRVKGRARDWNWHNVAGVWLGVPLLLISATGTIMAYPWANALLFRAAGQTAPVRMHRPPKDAAPLDARMYPQLDTAIAAAQASTSGWKSLELHLPGAREKDVTVVTDTSDSGLPQERVRYQINLKSGETTHVERFETSPRGTRWRTEARFLHTGELFGIAGKAVALLAALAGLLLAWTGVALSWRRWRQWRLRAS